MAIDLSAVIDDGDSAVGFGSPNRVNLGDLDHPLPPPATDADFLLDDLQPNIVKAHVRETAFVVALRFPANDSRAARDYLARFAEQMKSARRHLRELYDFKKSGKPGSPLLAIFLSSAGYECLGIPQDRRPVDPSSTFSAGMAQRGGLADPPQASWDEFWREPVHAMLLIGGAADSMKELTALQQLKDQIVDAATAAGIGSSVQEGLGMRSLLAEGEGIEHFGYVDGRSQPLFLKSDIDAQSAQEGIGNWSPRFGLKQVLVRDPGGAGDNSFGSYMVYRKLEQDVRGFKAAEAELAKRLGLEGEAAERAGATIVGRFEDGTPVTLQKADGMHSPVPNNFNYNDDMLGRRCPFHAHIRKVNPRTDTGNPDNNPEQGSVENERDVTIARRGITYGVRDRHPNDPALQLVDLPRDGVGLLFMAYQSDISKQFERMQQRWANTPSFPFGDPGIDPLIGQGHPGGQNHRHEWGNPESETVHFDFAGFVTLKGGEYFFAPSLSFLRGLGRP